MSRCVRWRLLNTDSGRLHALAQTSSALQAAPQLTTSITRDMQRRLSIQEIANLGALSGVRASVRPAYDQIASALVAEIILLTFNRPQSYAVPAAAAAASNGRSTAVAAASGPVAHHARIAALLAERQDAAAVRRAAGGFRAGGTEEGDVRMQKLLDALVQLDAVDLLRDGVLTAVEPQVPHCTCVSVRPLHRLAVPASLSHAWTLCFATEMWVGYGGIGSALPVPTCITAWRTCSRSHACRFGR